MSRADLGWLLVGPAGIIAAALVLPNNRAAVLAPALAALLITVWFFTALRARDRHGLAILEVGSVYVLAVALYALYPIVAYAANGFDYRGFPEPRLALLNPSPYEVGSLLWLYVAYLAAFAVTYLVVRGHSGVAPGPVPNAKRRMLLAALILLLVVEAFLLVLYFAYDLRAESYRETYLVVNKLPLVLRQLYNHLQGVGAVCQLFVLTFLFSRFRRFKWLIAAWVAAVGVTVIWGGGARSPLIVMIIAAATLYHVQVRRWRTRSLVLAGVVSLAVFLVVGVVRGEFERYGVKRNFNPLSSGTEFDAIFGNAVEIDRLKESGALRDLPVGFAFSDFLALVPQQLLPIAKTSASNWYLRTFHPEYAEQGGGFAFGAVAEATMGYGIASAIWRGAVIGLIFAILHRRFAHGKRTIWALTFYTWLIVWSYQAFRSTTFSLVVLFAYQFAVAWVAVQAISIVLTRPARWATAPLAMREERF